MKPPRVPGAMAPWEPPGTGTPGLGLGYLGVWWWHTLPGGQEQAGMVPLLHVKPRPGQRHPGMLPAQPLTAGSGSHMSPTLRHRTGFI